MFHKTVENWQIDKDIIEANTYMLRNEIACDVTFVAGEAKEEIRAHRYMLMSRSSVLHDLLSTHPDRKDIGIAVPDISAETVRIVLRYMYTDQIEIHAGNVTSILYAAGRVAIKGLSVLCFDFLDSELHTGNVCKIIEHAHIYKEHALFDKCKTLILRNGVEVLKTTGFSELCEECVGTILQSDDLRAPEELIFEATMAWAAAECRRQKLQPSDENKRQVLGPLLYFIRFPTMDVVYFTQKVSFRELLSNDEAVSIFQYFHGEEHTLANKFSKSERNRVPIKRDARHGDKNVKNRQNQQQTFNFSDKRRFYNTPIEYQRPSSPNMSKVTRFQTYDGQWKQNGPPDAVSFTCSAAIVLYGVEVYGSSKAVETYEVSMSLFDDFKEEVRRTESKIITDFFKSTYNVLFVRPIRIPAKRTFTIMVQMKGSPTVKGVDGATIHVVDGVTFEFSNSNRSSNGTDVTIGQIPSLLFSKAD